MPERSLEEVIQEEEFTKLLRTHVGPFSRLANTLLASKDWTKKHFYQLTSESDDLESFLDDYGAQYNRTFSFLRELVASVRWFALSGFSLVHLDVRLESYDVVRALTAEESVELEASLARARAFVREATEGLLRAFGEELERLGGPPSLDTFQDGDFQDSYGRVRLPRNAGQEDPVDERQNIAEVASKFLAACAMFEQLSIRRVEEPSARAAFLARICTEEQARVYEATVHNLQSTYDTYIKNTVLESEDDRLSRLRGHTSAVLHLSEAVTFLTHFVERHENGQRTEDADRRIASLIDPVQVQDVILNHLLLWAGRLMKRGRALAEELLPAYTNVRELTVKLPDHIQLHARPAALIVGIVGHYGTPVELEVDGQKCNAGSILELLVTVGSHPDARRFVLRGDEKPLEDIGMLFAHGLGEHGTENLPDRLNYLRNG